MSRFARPAEDEIIEDSEPEREEQRIRRKTKRKILTGRTGVSQKDVLPRKRSPCHEVIVISDESDAVHDNLKPSATYDIDVQLGTGDPVLDEPFSWDLPEDTLPPPILRAKSTDAPAKSRDPSPVTVRTTSEREESPEKPRKLPNFAQYAYTGSRASSLSVVSRPSVPILSRDTPEVNPPPPPKPKAKPKPVHRFTVFKDSELAPLRKCVSCELSWTLRKTVAQKMKHIQTCARKNKLEDDTVVALIRAELARTLESGQPTSTSTSKAPGAEVAATLLENVVQDGPKKKGRRPKVVESVKQLADTRESILERARLLLQSQPPAGPSKSKSPPSAASTSVASPPPPPPATQAFGESALAQKYQSKSKAIPDPTQPPARVPSPPASPTFGESNLAKQFHVQAKASYTYPEHDSSPVYIPSPLAQRNQGSDPPVLLSPSPTPRRLQGDGDRDLVLGRDNPVSLLSHPDSVNEPGPSRLPPLGNGSQDLNGFPQLVVAQETYSPRTVDSDDDGDGDGIMHFEPDIERYDYDSVLGSGSSEDEGAILHYEPDDFYAQGDIHGCSSDSSSSGSLSSLGILRPRARRSSSPLIADDMVVKTKGKGKAMEVAKKKRRRASKALSGSESDAVPLAKPAILPLAKSSPRRSPSRTKKVKSTATRKPRSKKSATRDVDVDDPAVTTGKTKSKGKSKAIQLTDDELFAKLRESILQDTELYLRVLRYEPVHFDVFLKLAGDTGVSDRGLKLRVRAFLDKQAIHFYGLVVSRSRTKKRRA